MARSSRMEWRSAVLSADGPRGAAARVVAVVLAEFASHDTMLAWPSNSHIGECADLSPSSVRRALRLLESSGWVEKSAAGGVPGGPKTTRWKLTTPVNLTGVHTTDPSQSDRGQHSSNTTDPSQSDRGQSNPHPVDNSTDPGQSDTPTPVNLTATPVNLTATPVNLTATPVNLTPEPVITSKEPEGVTRVHHLQGDLIQRGDPKEVEAVLSPLRDKHGADVLTEALQVLRDNNRTYRWPRDLAAALEPTCSNITAHRNETATRTRNQPDPAAITGTAVKTRAAKARAALKRQ